MSLEISVDNYEPDLGLKDYLRIVNRRKFYFIVPFVILFIASSLVVMKLPAIYRSSATILIESQQIPSDLVRSTITSYADERIEFIRKKVLTRANILEIVEKYDLFSEQHSKMTATEIVDLFRSNIEIGTVNANVGKRGGSATIAFTIAYLSELPKTAQLVTDELVTLFLNENAQTRASRAAETTDFLTQEAVKIRDEVKRMEGLVGAYKLQNKESLPELLEMNLDMMERLERDYLRISTDLEGLAGELKTRRLQLVQYRSTVGGAPGSSLIELQNAYDELMAQYTPTHPDILAVKRRIEQVKKSRAATAGQYTEEDPSLLNDPTYALLRGQIEATASQVEYLTATRDQLAQELEDIEARVSRAPAVEQELNELERDLDNLTAKYQEIKNKELEARISQNLEEDRKGERFTLLEPPLVPQKSHKPDRPKLLVFGFFLACAAGGGLALLTEGLDPALRGQLGAARILGSTPLVVIPYIETGADTARRKNRLIYLFIIAVLGGIAALAGIHFFYESLDVLWYTLLLKFASF